jgi:hypothetical protein
MGAIAEHMRQFAKLEKDHAKPHPSRNQRCLTAPRAHSKIGMIVLHSTIRRPGQPRGSNRLHGRYTHFHIDPGETSGSDQRSTGDLEEEQADLKPEKCKREKTKMEYLGLVILAESVEMDRRR